MMHGTSAVPYSASPHTGTSESPGSPFDSIRRVDERGEYWLARELVAPLGYTNWRRFADAIDRARVALSTNREDPNVHIERLTPPSNGRGAASPRDDYRLTRYGVYATIQGADPRKPEIAAGWAYFRVRTREAEVQAELDELEVARRYVHALESKKQLEVENAEQRGRLAIAEPKAEYVDGFVQPDQDASLIRVFAGQLGMKETALRDWMVGRKLIYRRDVGQRWSRSLHRLVPEYQWLAYADRKTWFQVVDQPEAPRLHNGQMATTLYVTPIGKVSIRRMLERERGTDA